MVVYVLSAQDSTIKEFMKDALFKEKQKTDQDDEVLSELLQEPVSQLN